MLNEAKRGIEAEAKIEAETEILVSRPA